MAKKIKLIKPTDTSSLTYTCPPGYAARLELVGGYIAIYSSIQIIDLATNVSVWSLYLETFNINSDAPLLGERWLGSGSTGSSMISIPPEYIAYYGTQAGYQTPIQGFRKIWYLDGGAVGEKFTISSPNGLTARILVIEEEHNNPAASISSVSTTNVASAGAYVYFNVVSSNFSNGSTLYWTINHNAGSPYQSYQTNNDDFLATNGSFTINNNAGSFMIQVKPGPSYPYNEYQEYFKVAIRQNSITGDILGLSPVITITPTIYSD